MAAEMKRAIEEAGVLLRSIPAPVVTLFTVSVILMNLLANKSISFPIRWLALDCGILVSWVSFLSMDVVTRHFGAKAATELSIFAVAVNLLCCFFFWLAGAIPGQWGESFSGGEAVNRALDRTVSGTWYVLLGSSVAFLSSALVNNGLNAALGKRFHSRPDGFGAFAVRTYLSTAVGQFCDNLIFALIVSHFFFGWTFLQCVVCSLTGMTAELILEILFSPIGYKICRNWQADGVGQAYFTLRGKRDKCES